MDAFYAAIEQLDHPELRGRPILVGPKSRRGVVLTASYEARPYKVGSAMPMAVARRRCPEAIVVPPRFDRYQAVSKQVMSVLADFSPRVEPLSLDEAFVDMSGAEHLFGEARAMGERIKQAVYAATGLTISVGISGTKYVAKVASDYGKPDGLTIVAPERARAWLAPLPVARLWGAGPKMQQRLAALGFHTIGDVAAAEPAFLAEQLGRAGTVFAALARGEDPRHVQASRRSKSIGSERTLAADISAPSELRHHLRAAAAAVGRRLRRQRYRARGVRVKLKRADFQLLTRQRRLPEPTDHSDDLYRIAVSLLDTFADSGPFRLVGIAAYDLELTDQDLQLGLLGSEEGAKAERLEAVLDQLDGRFGRGTVQRAADLMRPGGIGPEVNLDFLSDEPES